MILLSKCPEVHTSDVTECNSVSDFEAPETLYKPVLFKYLWLTNNKT